MLEPLQYRYSLELEEPAGTIQLGLRFTTLRDWDEEISTIKYETHISCDDTGSAAKCCQSEEDYNIREAGFCFVQELSYGQERKIEFDSAFLARTMSRYPDKTVGQVLDKIKIYAKEQGFNFSGAFSVKDYYEARFESADELMFIQFKPIADQFYTSLMRHPTEDRYPHERKQFTHTQIVLMDGAL